MPKRCTDPRCPLNKTTNKLQKDFCKIHGRPCVTFAFDDARNNHRERERGRKCSKSNKVRDTRELTKRDRSSNSRCCKNKKCQTSKCTVERSTSTNSRPKIQSHASGKSGMYFHRYKDKGRPCECRHKRCCKREEETTSEKKERSGKGIRQYRSRRKRKRKYSWLRKCFRRLCICAKIPSSMESSECCCTYRDKYEERSKNSKRSRKHIFPASDETWRKDNRLVRKCQCLNTIDENRLLPRDQSYIQSAFSRGLNVMRRGINLCL